MPTMSRRRPFSFLRSPTSTSSAAAWPSSDLIARSVASSWSFFLARKRAAGRQLWSGKGGNKPWVSMQEAKKNASIKQAPVSETE